MEFTLDREKEAARLGGGLGGGVLAGDEGQNHGLVLCASALRLDAVGFRKLLLVLHGRA